MCKRLVYLVSCALVLGATCSALAAPEGLVAYWPFDEGEGATAFDQSGNGNDGAVDNAAWVTGTLNGALQFDGTSSEVMAPHIEFDNRSFTIAAWINPVLSHSMIYFSQRASDATDLNVHLRLGGTGVQYGPVGGLRFGFYNNDLDTPANVFEDNTWYHITVWYNYDTQDRRIYINGEQVAQDASTPYLGTTGSTVIGSWDTGEFYEGLLDDIQVYQAALTDAEIVKIMKGLGAEGIAGNPVPADGATDVPRDVVLGWTPGEFPGTHNVYLGTNFDDVNAADAGSDLLVSPGQAASTYDPPGRLEFGQTYYWRIDEVNSTPDSTVFKGAVWSFTTEPDLYPVANIVATASIDSSPASGGMEATVDGSGLTDGMHGVSDSTMWSGMGVAGEPVVLQFDFDRLYKLYGIHVWNYNGLYEYALGFGLKDVTIEYAAEPNEWVALGDYQLARATNKATYTGEMLDLDGIVARAIRITANSSQSGNTTYGLAEIQFLYKAVVAREPQPADGDTEIDRATSLSWRPGREADTHQISFGTDSNAVADGSALIDTVASTTYDPGALQLGTTYYWKVDEANDVETPTLWAGDVWSFTTQEYVTIDNFDSYTDDAGNEIFTTWVDGYNITDNGSQVGHENPPYAEKTVTRSGQSMPFYYDNTGSVNDSEAERTFDAPQNWTANGADTLSLYYRGIATGFAQLADDNIVMNGTGSDIWGTTDQFRFVYKQLTGNGSIVARVEYVENTNEWAKAGVMIRSTLDADSVLVDGVVTPTSRVSMQWRTGRAIDMGSPDTASNSVVDSFEYPHWVKLTRNGDVFTVQHSVDGVTWVDIVPDTAGDPTQITQSMPATVYIGLAVCSHNATAVAGAQFTAIATTGNVTGQWQSASIGMDQAPGNGLDRFYLTVEDSSGKSTTLTNPSPVAVGMGSWQQWAIPLSDITAAGVNVNSVKKLYLGVGDKTQASKNAAGVLYIDDIAFGKPVE